MTEEFSSSSNLPDWILAAGPEISKSLRLLSEASTRLRDSVKNGYIYRHVLQSELNAVTDEMIARGILGKQGEILKKSTAPKEFYAAATYQAGSPFRILGMFVAAKQMAIVQLIEGALKSLQCSSLLLGMLSIRAVLEQIAHFDFVVNGLRGYTVSAKFDEANDSLFEINGFLASKIYATRIDWKDLILGDSEELLAKASKIRYKATEAREDLTAASILNFVDGLSKKVKGTRGVYDVLCEFAHPNVGMVLGLTQKIHLIKDKHGFHWVEKQISVDPPFDILAQTGDWFNLVFKITAECVRHFECLIPEAELQRVKIQEISRVVLRHTFAKRGDIINVYAPCPCGSGSKVKFCCATTA